MTTSVVIEAHGVAVFCMCVTSLIHHTLAKIMEVQHLTGERDELWDRLTEATLQLNTQTIKLITSNKRNYYE